MFQENYCGVYLITVQPTGHFYVGSAANMPHRRERHITTLRKHKHHNMLLQRLFDQYGETALEFSVLALCRSRKEAYRIEALELEARAVSELLLNIGKHVQGGDNLSRHPNRLDVIARTSQTLRLQIAELGLAGRKAKYGQPGPQNGMAGRRHSEQAKLSIAVSAAGNTRSAGRRMSASQREHLSQLARQRTAEANPFYGRQHTEETRQKISESRRASAIIPASARAVEIEGKIYSSIKRAMIALQLSRYVIKQRLADPAFPTYREI